MRDEEDRGSARRRIKKERAGGGTANTHNPHAADHASAYTNMAASKSDKFAFIGTAHVLIGTFTGTNGLVSLGEQANTSIPFSGGSKAMVRTASGHSSARGGVDYGRTAGLDLELDQVSAEILATLISAMSTDTAGNMTMSTSASAMTTVSALVIPSAAIDATTGKVVNPQACHWLPFLTDDGDFAFTFDNSRGENANKPVSVSLTGLVDDMYGTTALPVGARNWVKGVPPAGTGWTIPAPYTPAP